MKAVLWIAAVGATILSAQFGYSQPSATQPDEKFQIRVTGLDKKSYHIDTRLVARLRGALPHEGAGGSTRIDWVNASFAIEGPTDVAARVKSKLPSLVQVKQPNGSPLWFNVDKAVGPFRVYLHEQREGVRTVVLIQNRRQLLANTHEELAQAIRSGGGTPLANPDGIDLLRALKSLQQMIFPLPKWD